MLTRMIVIGLVAALALAVIILFLYQHVTGVGVIRKSSKNNRREKPKASRRPQATAYIVGSDTRSDGSQVEVPLYSVGEMYAAVGVGQNDFSLWREKYGFGTFGRTEEGALFVPDYPILSKISEMGIDQFVLSSAETSMLIEECERAKSMPSTSPTANIEFESLIALARRAIALGGAVGFA